MNNPVVTASLPANAAAVPLAQWRLVLGLGGLLVWLAGFAATEFAHDLLMAAGEGERTSSAAHLLYEVSAGYVLGFIAALAITLLARTLRGEPTDLLWNLRWARGLAAIGLGAVTAACIAGAVMHNFGGLTLSYDVAFVIGCAVVWLGVLPLATHIERERAR
jgi:hypothetical protein